MVGAFVFFYFILYIAGCVVSPDLSKNALKEYGPEVLAGLDSLRNLVPDLKHSPRIQVPVNYAEGNKAAWYPKNESPILRELVEEGALPPVAERVGPEPVVLQGVEGNGKYGGTWVRILTGGPDADNRIGYTTLVRFSPYGYPVVPHVAKRLEFSADRKTLTIHLRKGMRWSDGHPFTADDIMFWWISDALDTTISDGKGGFFSTDGVPDKLEKIDAYTVRLTAPKPKGGLLEGQLASFYGKFLLERPRHYLEQFHPVVGDSAVITREMALRKKTTAYAMYREVMGAENVEKPTLNPWIRRTFQASPPIRFVRNPYYFAVDTDGNQLPYVDQLQYDTRKDELVGIAASTGQITMQAKMIRFDQYTNLMRCRDQGGYEVYHWIPGDASAWSIAPNLNKTIENRTDSLKADVLGNLDFRKALSLSINRQQIIDAEYYGQARPCQVGAPLGSVFYDSLASHMYTAFAPDEANRLLDGMGLTGYDAEGYRTFRDGTRMTFYLIFTAFTGAGPAQFVVDDWRAVGVRVVPQERSANLFTALRRGRTFDLCAEISNGEFFPVLEPFRFIPTSTWSSSFALDYAFWYTKGGLRGDPRADRHREPPMGAPMRTALEQYDAVRFLADPAAMREAFVPVMRAASSELWNINICSAPPVLAIVKRGFRNVPRKLVYTWPFQSPGNAGPETFYFDEPANSPGAVAIIKHEMTHATPNPKLVEQRSGGTGSGKLVVRIIVALLIIGGITLAILKKPYIARRLAVMVPMLFVISVIVFVIIQLPPGDYLTSYITQLAETGEGASTQIIDELTQQFNLDRPMVERYFRWVGLYWFTTFNTKDTGLLQGNLGRSMEKRLPVNDMVGDRILLTFLISLGTILFTWIIALPIGIYSAVRQYSIGDYVLTFIGFIGMCIPAFLMALVLMALGGVSGLFSAEFASQPEWDWPKFVDLLKHIWIPIVVLGIGGTAGMIRVMRGNLLDELKKPYVVTAMSKGVRPMKLLLKYPVRLALNPFISGIGGILPALISGNAIVAMVLALPTVGPLMLNALLSEDMYLAGSMLLVLSGLGIIGTLVSDLLLLWVDPRIRFKSGTR